jgi:23S rRNA (guanine745-N1)-methyltransferase
VDGLSDAVGFLRCPVCAAGLRLEGAVVRCTAGHGFDVARQGYVDLMPPGRRPAGDSAEMIAARQAFLAAGHYAAIAEAVARVMGRDSTVTGEDGGLPGGRDDSPARDATAAAEDGGLPGGRDDSPARGVTPGREGVASAGCVVEVGAGTGYYLAAARGSVAGIALDSSRYAARRAARAGLASVVCDAWRALPVRDGVAAAVLCVFAPRNPGEMRRISAPGGRIVVVTPTLRHLAEIVGPLGLVSVDERKQERLEAALGVPVDEELVERTLELSRADVRALIAMGPSARHVDPDALARPATVTLSVRVGVY